jgi:hypothetical protein
MKQRILSLLWIILLSVTLHAKEKPRVAVVDFREVNCKVADLGKTSANRINDILVNLGSVTVIDRVNLEQILKEQNIGLSGILDKEGNYSVGKISGINYLVVGEVVQGSVTKSLEEKTYKEKLADGSQVEKPKKVYVYRGIATLQARVIDVNTGRIIFSGSKSEKAETEEPYVEEKPMDILTAVVHVATKTAPKKEEPKDPNQEKAFLAIRSTERAAQNFAQDFFELFKPEGFVLAVEESKGQFIVTLDIGKDFGVKKNDVFEVIQKGPPVIHPVTGDVYPGKVTNLGKIKVKEVGENTSTAYVKKKIGKTIAPGMNVRTLKRGGCL